MCLIIHIHTELTICQVDISESIMPMFNRAVEVFGVRPGRPSSPRDILELNNKQYDLTMTMNVIHAAFENGTCGHDNYHWICNEIEGMRWAFEVDTGVWLPDWDDGVVREAQRFDFSASIPMVDWFEKYGEEVLPPRPAPIQRMGGPARAPADPEPLDLDAPSDEDEELFGEFDRQLRRQGY